METFDQIWASSRSNGWSWGYPATLWSGISLLIGLSLIRTVWVRRIVKIAAILLLTALATELASLEILEKWRIRREWANANQPLMTPAAQQALTVDGANLTLGPLFYGLQAFLWAPGVHTVCRLGCGPVFSSANRQASTTCGSWIRTRNDELLTSRRSGSCPTGLRVRYGHMRAGETS
jgi:hypothetical protein